eukprot:TRINITY_DN41027_c0_g1_i1.p1 TRINITY_DN41027_c0_g1~~TRINITY_DN41027_c0_g1_i1.p1  ORF type:complete len:261 (-),score=25.14 TRINITY_DN41027_c0_g1_i1:268-993(-)
MVASGPGHLAVGVSLVSVLVSAWFTHPSIDALLRDNLQVPTSGLDQKGLTDGKDDTMHFDAGRSSFVDVVRNRQALATVACVAAVLVGLAFILHHAKAVPLGNLELIAVSCKGLVQKCDDHCGIYVEVCVEREKRVTAVYDGSGDCLFSSADLKMMRFPIGSKNISSSARNVVSLVVFDGRAHLTDASRRHCVGCADINLDVFIAKPDKAVTVSFPLASGRTRVGTIIISCVYRPAVGKTS